MQRFVDSIDSSIKSENWFAALFLALAIPDICGALENPDKKNYSKFRYKDWFNRYLRSRYDPRNQYEETLAMGPQFVSFYTDEQLDEMKEMESSSPKFTADDCYFFRCRCLHEGLPIRSEKEVVERRIHFTVPDKRNGTTVVHRAMVGNILQLSVAIFCADVARGVERWVTENAANPDIQSRISNLINVYALDDAQLPIVTFNKDNGSAPIYRSNPNDGE